MHAKTWLLVSAFVTSTTGAFARGRGNNDTDGQLSVDADPIWLAQVPMLPISSDSDTTFNALHDVALPAGGPNWFAGGGLDVRLGPMHGSWFIPILGFRVGVSDFHRSLSVGDNVSVALDTLTYLELLLPGIGYRFGDYFSLSARLAYVSVDALGSATDGHITLAVDGNSDGFGILGEAKACLGPASSVCLFAQPAALYVGGPDFALSFGVRLVWDPTR